MRKKIESKFTFLKYFQLIGVVIGLVVTGYLITFLNFNNLKFADVISVFLMLLFFGLNLYVYSLFQNKKHEKALKWMSFMLIIQLISVTINGFFYSAVHLFGINFKLDLTSDTIIGLDFQFSHFMATISSDSSSFLIKINLVALFMLFYISKINHELKTINNQL
jgi:hypothetical protein